MKFEGYYQYPGRAARCNGSIRASLDNRTLVLVVDEQTVDEHNVDQQALDRHAADKQTITYIIDSIDVSEPLGTIPLTLTFADGGRFVPHNDSEFRRWYHAVRKPSTIFLLEKYKRGIFVALGLTVVSVFLYIKVVLPYASNVIAHNIPASIESLAGEDSYELLVNKIYSPTKLPIERQQELKALFEATIPESMRNEKTPVQLKFIRFGGDPNAFMLPNGYLVLSDELIELAKNDNQIASVMLHEMGHHYHRHGMQSIVSASMLSLSIMLVTGDVSGIGDTILQGASGLLQLQYSRQMEEEADQFAITNMQQQQRDLEDMYTIFDSLSAQSDIDYPTWLSTHPDMESRIEKIKHASENHK